MSETFIEWLVAVIMFLSAGVSTAPVEPSPAPTTTTTTTTVVEEVEVEGCSIDERSVRGYCPGESGHQDEIDFAEEWTEENDQ